MVVEQNGWLVDDETAEILGVAGRPATFEVTDLSSAEWVLERVQECDALVTADTLRLDAIKAQLEARIKDHKRRRAWLLRKWAGQLEEFARQNLLGKTKTLKTAFGSLSFRKSPTRILPLDGALEWVKIHCPDAVKVEERILTTPLKGMELPEKLFEMAGGDEGFWINTGLCNTPASQSDVRVEYETLKVVAEP